MALELSKATWLVALHAPDCDKLSQHCLAGSDVEALLGLIDKTRARAEAQIGKPVRVVSCYEVGHDGFWLHRLLCEHGIENYVLDASSLLVDRRARHAKTDRLDVEVCCARWWRSPVVSGKSAAWFMCRAKRKRISGDSAVSVSGW